MKARPINSGIGNKSGFTRTDLLAILAVVTLLASIVSVALGSVGVVVNAESTKNASSEPYGINLVCIRSMNEMSDPLIFRCTIT